MYILPKHILTAAFARVASDLAARTLQGETDIAIGDKHVMYYFDNPMTKSIEVTIYYTPDKIINQPECMIAWVPTSSLGNHIK